MNKLIRNVSPKLRVFFYSEIRWSLKNPSKEMKIMKLFNASRMKCVGEQKLRNEKLKNSLQSRIQECKKRIEE